jgi:hypothetical protein
MTTEWEEKFHLSTAQALPQKISDHTPLLLKSEDDTTWSSQPMFKFETGWLLRDGFIDMIRDIWSYTSSEGSPMEEWQGKICRVRQYLRGWVKHTSGQYKNEKKRILNTLDGLDKKAETTHLPMNKINLKHYLNNRFAELLREEEIKWYQRAKVKELLEGDSNMKYFQLVANGKYRKNRIFQLQQAETIIEGDEALKQHITRYYKELFGPSENNMISLDESHLADIPQVTELKNEMLIQLLVKKRFRKPSSKWNIIKAPVQMDF